jgi:CheY-like chemotaxis protein
MAKKILVVDDDTDYLFQQELLLKKAGYDVITAESAAQGKEALRLKPDLAVVDLMMEELDAGFTLCYHFKKQRPDMPVILVTAVTRETGLEFDAATVEERNWIKADSMLAKPVRFEQLQSEISRLLQEKVHG